VNSDAFRDEAKGALGQVSRQEGEETTPEAPPVLGHRITSDATQRFALDMRGEGDSDPGQYAAASRVSSAIPSRNR
jgi:hypothetical protein